MSKNKEITALTKALTEALATQGVDIGHQQAQNVLAKMLQQENYHAMAAKLKRVKPGTTPVPAATEGQLLHGILISVNPEYVPEDGDAFDAVFAALDHFEIPATVVEGSFYATSGGTTDRSLADGLAPNTTGDLDNRRRDEADRALASYDFGEGVTVEDSSGWEFAGHSWECPVFVALAEDPPEASTHKVTFAVEFGLGTADVVICQALLDGKPIGKSGVLGISAEIHSDDYVSATDFDAAPWFAKATDEDIWALHGIEWRGDEEADNVALALEDKVPYINAVLEYCRGTRTFSRHVGFEVSVDESSAMKWLKSHRNGLWARILCDQNEVSLMQAQEPEILGMWDWLGNNGNACDHSFDTEEEAAQNAVEVLGLCEQ